jgi:hypothetical protein
VHELLPSFINRKMERLVPGRPDGHPRPDASRLLCFPLGPATMQRMGGALKVLCLVLVISDNA